MSKLDKRAISILVIVTFLMSVIPIMPAQAITVSVTGTTPITSTGVLLGSGGDGYAVWSSVAVQGTQSVKMYTGTTAAVSYGKVEVAITPVLMSALTDVSYMVYEPDVDAGGEWPVVTEVPYGHPYMNLFIDFDGLNLGTGEYGIEWDALEGVGSSAGGVVDLAGVGADPDEDTWTEMKEGWGYYDQDDSMNTGYVQSNPKSLTDWKTAILAINPSAVVYMVQVRFGQWTHAPHGPLYVDNVCVNSVVYPMEASIESAQYGDTLTVSGDGITSGSEVQIYWDIATGTGAHLLNTTEGKPDATYECEIDIPSDTPGNHYIWVVDVATGDSIRYLTSPIFVLPKIKISPKSGLVDDEVTVKGYGLSAESEVSLTFRGNPLSVTPETDEDGYFTCTFDVPDPTPYGQDYPVVATCEKGWSASADFDVGASITLTPDEGPTGSIVTVEGRGWTDESEISFTIDSTIVQVVDDEVITVASDGTFEAEIVIPGMASKTEYTIEASENPETYGPASADFDVTGIAEIVVSPTYGTPGATITVTGSNFTQIAGTEVNIDLYETDGTTFVADLVIAETKSDGTFEDIFVSPAVTFTTYDVIAEDDYEIDADDAFKVGLIALIINPIYGEAGTDISITGIGFEDGAYNVTFGEKLYEEYGKGVDGEAISDTFYVPNFEPGTYDLTVIDTEDNELTVQFTVTESTYVIADPAMAPNEYNVSIKGYNFADVADTVDFVIYNVTDDGEVDEEWEMEVYTTTDDPLDPDPTKTGTDGNFTGWWEVLPKDDLSLGDYMINVTGSQGLLVQVPFSVVAARVSVEPRKAQFDRGDMIQFDINNDFKLPDAYIEIYSPSDILYWSTDTFGDTYWMLVEGLYTVPYYRQTDDIGNPMELQSDAPMGTWLYRFYEDADTELMNGTFTVGPSTAAQVEERLTEIWGSIDDLTTNIDSITDELAGDISDLSGDIDDVVADVQDMVDDITADLAEELAGVAADTEAAVGELEGAIGDIASAQNELQSDLDDMSQDTAAAKEAAEDSQSTAQGLTTLVYGAIAASLVAALAAVVSLMQISKKIA